MTPPLAALERPPANKGRRSPAELLTTDEIRALIRACSARAPTGIRNRALIAVLYRGGLRISEALALYPKDLDQGAGTVTVLHGKGDQRRTAGMDPRRLLPDGALARQAPRRRDWAAAAAVLHARRPPARRKLRASPAPPSRPKGGDRKARARPGLAPRPRRRACSRGRAGKSSAMGLLPPRPLPAPYRS